MASAQSNQCAHWAQQIYGISYKPATTDTLRSEIEDLVGGKYLHEFSKWRHLAQQTYGESYGLHSDIEYLVAKKYLAQVGTTEQPPSTSNSSNIISILMEEFQHSKTTQKTTLEHAAPTETASAESTANTERDLPGSATTTERVSRNAIEATTYKKDSEGPSLEVDERIWYPDPTAVDKWVRSLPPRDQLEYLVKIKIKNFRDKLDVQIPLGCRLWEIDRDEDGRRLKYFQKHGRQAFFDQYIDSDYVGPVEFLYIDPKESDELKKRMANFWKPGKRNMGGNGRHMM